METVTKELLLEIEARERTYACTTNHNPPSRRPSKELGTTATLFTKGTTLQCCFCNQQHPSEKCQVLKGSEERKRSLVRTGRCFICMARGHISRNCRSKTRCTACNGRHHHAICGERTELKCSQETPPSSGASQEANSDSTASSLNPGAKPFQHPSASLLVGAKGAILLQTASVQVYDPERPERSMNVRAILDTGSQQSYASQHVKDTLLLKPRRKHVLSMMTFGSNDLKTCACDVIRVGLTTRDGMGQELELFTVPLVCHPLTAQPIDLCATKYQHLSSLDLADSSNEDAPMEVDLLIGSDCYWTLVTGRVCRGEAGPVAIHTRLGWVLSGIAPTPGELHAPHSCLTTHVLKVDATPPCSCSEKLDEMLHSFWKLESLGIEDSGDTVLDEFTQSIRFSEGRYEVLLPWKDSHPPLHDNFDLSNKRLHSLLLRLRRDPDVMHEYDAIIRSQLQQAIVEEVNPHNKGRSGRVHYLPHHAMVRKDRETTKLRIVYDASAKATGCSLNECLLKGPKFDQKIFDILLRFRTYKVAVTADIEKAFLMVSIADEDRDVLRFLWVNNVDNDSPQLRILRFRRVVFGVSSSPFLLNATLQHHLDLYAASHPEVVERLLESLYVDDVVSGAQDEDQAETFYLKSKQILREGGFNLRKFVTNSKSLQQRIDDCEGVTTHEIPPHTVSHLEESYTKSMLGTTQPNQPGEQKVLGVRWDVAKDQFCFGFTDIAHCAAESEPTKRNLISIVGRFYDPIGFLAPIVIKFKILLQELSERKIDWDKPLSGDLLRKWETLITDLQSNPPMSLPRCIWAEVPTEDVSCRLYGFCDASKHAYAAIVYLVIQTPDERIVRFISSKTRVAPLKSQTIPRLELLSALILARLLKNVTTSLESGLKLGPPICYADSKVAFFWILKTKRVWKQFVQRRVTEIRELLPDNCWHHCPGIDNPADLPSRGLSPIELACSELWAKGPRWLGSPTANESVQDMTMPEDCATELRMADRPATVSLLVADVKLDIDCQQYSSLQKLLRVTARVLMFVNNLKGKLQIKHNATTKVTPVSEVELLTQAEMLWIKIAQRQLAKNGYLQKQFDLFLDDDGIWRCGGRLSNADIPYQTRHPILLPRDHYLTTLIVRRAHQRVLHNGVKDTLSEVRSRYWIVKGRAFVKKTIHHCIICRKLEGKPFLGPSPPPLPSFRLTEDPPFTYTGVDFAGPLHIKKLHGAGGHKVWICLYTCCVVRAVHLDIVPNMTTTTFIHSLKHFSSRRGLPKRFVSDNGQTFKAAAKVVRTIVHHRDVQHDFEVTSKHLTRRFVYLNRVLNDFWRRWRTEYLLELREAHRHGFKTNNVTPVGVGDVVLVHDDNSPRGFWKIALVRSLIVGRAGRVRGAVLKVGSADSRESLLQRPLQRLYPLEIGSAPNNSEVSNPDSGEPPQEPEQLLQEADKVTETSNTAEAGEICNSGHPKRVAARNSRHLNQAIAILEQDEFSD